MFLVCVESLLYTAFLLIWFPCIFIHENWTSLTLFKLKSKHNPTQYNPKHNSGLGWNIFMCCISSYFIFLYFHSWKWNITDNVQTPIKIQIICLRIRGFAKRERAFHVMTHHYRVISCCFLKQQCWNYNQNTTQPNPTHVTCLGWNSFICCTCFYFILLYFHFWKLNITNIVETTIKIRLIYLCIRDFAKREWAFRVMTYNSRVITCCFLKWQCWNYNQNATQPNPIQFNSCFLFKLKHFYMLCVFILFFCISICDSGTSVLFWV